MTDRERGRERGRTDVRMGWKVARETITPASLLASVDASEGEKVASASRGMMGDASSRDSRVGF